MSRYINSSYLPMDICMHSTLLFCKERTIKLDSYEVENKIWRWRLNPIFNIILLLQIE